MNLRMNWWAFPLALFVSQLSSCGDNSSRVPATNESAPKLAGPSLARLQAPGSVSVAGDTRATGLVITYRISGLNRGGEIKVYGSGAVEVFQWGNMPLVPEGQSSMSEHYTLSPDRLSSLINQFREAEFFSFAGAYVVHDPPQVVYEYDWRTLTFSDNGQSKSITLRGPSQVPTSLNKLLEEIGDLWRKPTS